MANVLKYFQYMLLVNHYVVQTSAAELPNTELNSTNQKMVPGSDLEMVTSEGESESSSSWSLDWSQTLDPNQTVNFYQEVTAVYEDVLFYPRLYLWDKARISPRDFQQSICPSRCVNNQTVIMPDMSAVCLDIVCFTCECKRPECEIYGICCPDILEPYFSKPPKESHAKKDETSKFYQNTTDNDISRDELSQMSSNTTIAAMTEVPSLNDSTASGHGFFNFGDVPNSALLKHQKKTLSPKLECDEKNEILYIKSCNPDVKVSHDVISKCESGVPQDEINVDSMAYTTDVNTHVVYYNTHCAMCNLVNETRKWQVNVVCTNYMHVYTARTQDELLRQSLQPDSHCSVTQRVPNGFEAMPCKEKWYSSVFVNTCNVTGQWLDYDEDVVRACAMLSDPIYKVRFNTIENSRPVQLYSTNVFCAICNRKVYPKFITCGRAGIPGKVRPPPPFSSLFNLRSRHAPSNQRSGLCYNTEWANPSGSCMPAQCFPGKDLVDGKCNTALDQIRGLGYRIQLWFIPGLGNATTDTHVIDTPPSGIILTRFYSQLFAVLDPLVSDLELSIGVVVNVSKMGEFQEAPPVVPAPPDVDYNEFYYDNTDISTFTPTFTTFTTTDSLQQQFAFQTPYLYWVSGRIIAKKNIRRDSLERAIINTLLHENHLAEFAAGIAVNFTPVVMWESSDTVTYCTDIARNSSDIKCYDGSVLFTNTYSINEYSESLGLFLNITEILTCSFVSFQSSQFVVEKSLKDFLPVVVITLHLNPAKIVFSNHSELNKLAVGKNGSLHVCRELLDQKVASIKHVDVARDLNYTVQYILTLVCMGVSMLCLLLTIITYARFPVLRSVAGKNNVGLCSSLFLAQASLLASFHTNVDSVLCAPLGISTHFLWLCMLCWSFICCFYMYKVFGAKIRSSHTSPRSQRLMLVKSIMFSLLAPAVVVAAVVVAVFFTSGGTDIGYVGSSCYLNSNVLVGATMIGPVILTTCSNTAFFLITVMNIYRVRKLQKYHTPKKDEQQNLYVYMKLSTMTGAFWITFIIAEVADVDGLRILAILLNGLQGVFIFVSYICNKRVLILYIPSLANKNILTSTTDSTTARQTSGKLSIKKDEETSAENKSTKSISIINEEGIANTNNSVEDKKVS